MGRLQKAYSTCMECGGRMKMKKGQSGMLMEGPPMTYTTVNRGEYKGRVFADREIDPVVRQARIEEVRGLGRAGKLDRLQKQAAIDSVTTLNQMRNPNIISSKPAKAGGVCTPADVKNGNCRNKAEVHKQAAMGYGSGQNGMEFKDPMRADSISMSDVSSDPISQVSSDSISNNLPSVNMGVKAIDPNLKQGKQMVSDLEREAERESVRRYQQMLNTKYGLDLDVDGAWGKNTQAAYEKYVLNKSGAQTKPKSTTSTPTRTPQKMTPQQEAIHGTQKNPVRMQPVDIKVKRRPQPPRVLPTRPIPMNQPKLSDYMDLNRGPVNTRSYRDNTRMTSPVNPRTPVTRSSSVPKYLQNGLGYAPVGNQRSLYQKVSNNRR